MVIICSPMIMMNILVVVSSALFQLLGNLLFVIAFIVSFPVVSLAIPLLAEWSVPTVHGDPPQARSNYSFTPVDDKRAIVFGGLSKNGRSDEVHIIHWDSMVCGTCTA